MRINLVKSTFLKCIKRVMIRIPIHIAKIKRIFKKLIKSMFSNNKVIKYTHIRINLEFNLFYIETDENKISSRRLRAKYTHCTNPWFIHLVYFATALSFLSLTLAQYKRDSLSIIFEKEEGTSQEIHLYNYRN